MGMSSEGQLLSEESNCHIHTTREEERSERREKGEGAEEEEEAKGKREGKRKDRGGEEEGEQGEAGQGVQGGGRKGEKRRAEKDREGERKKDRDRREKKRKEKKRKCKEKKRKKMKKEKARKCKSRAGNGPKHQGEGSRTGNGEDGARRPGRYLRARPSSNQSLAHMHGAWEGNPAPTLRRQQSSCRATEDRNREREKGGKGRTE